jgi:NADPH:quinone reductase-like Zn-dependent oxidoreductase
MSRAVVINEFGGPEVLLIRDVPLESPGPGEVRLRVRAIGLNRTEITLRSGRSPIKPKLPSRIGFEAAGEIELIGSGVTGYNVGDRVALLPTYGAAQYGLYGETSLAPATSLVKISDDVSFVDAAATWVAFGTAWGGLLSVGKLKEGETVLISAASSSVGLAAIQIANRVGAHPIALTRTKEKVHGLLERGAAAVIATAEQDLYAEVTRLTNQKGVDLVFDPVGGPGFTSLAKSTRSGGLLILYGALDPQPTTIPPFDIIARDITIRGLALSALNKNDEARGALKDFVQAGLKDRSLKPAVARTFSFDEIRDAHRFIESGEHFGKVVITL